MYAFSRPQKKVKSSFFRNRVIAGFTLLELTVASMVSLTILSLSMGMLNEQRRQILSDRTRTAVNDNLRIASDLIGTDIKQAGERLESDKELPGISIIAGATAAVPSRLVLQRQLLAEKLNACQNVSTGTTTIDVSVVPTATPGSGIATCPYSYTLPDPIAPATVGVEPSATLTTLKPTANLRSWRTYRCKQGVPFTGTGDPCARTVAIPTTSNCKQLGGTDNECSWAYIRDPLDHPGEVQHRGEFFLYSFENPGTCAYSVYNTAARTCQRIHRADGNTWQYSYTYNPAKSLAEQPQLYLLEEREYRLTLDTDTSRTDDYILELLVNGKSPKRIANQFTNFQACAKLSSGLCSTFNFNQNLKFETDWRTLQGIQITFDSINPNVNLLKVNSNNLTLTSQFLPRNSLSVSPDE